MGFRTGVERARGVLRRICYGDKPVMAFTRVRFGSIDCEGVASVIAALLCVEGRYRGFLHLSRYTLSEEPA